MTAPFKLVIVSTIEMTDEDLCQWELWHRSEFSEKEDFYKKVRNGEEVVVRRADNHLTSYCLLKNNKVS